MERSDTTILVISNFSSFFRLVRVGSLWIIFVSSKADLRHFVAKKPYWDILAIFNSGSSGLGTGEYKYFFTCVKPERVCREISDHQQKLGV